MAVIKIACTKCGQRVSGDESFYGTTVECPVCSSIIAFPEPIDTSPPVAPKPEATTQEGSATNTEPGTPSLGGHDDVADPLKQTTSIPLLPENIVTQDANRIGALNAALQATPEEEPPSTLMSVLSLVCGVIGILFFWTLIPVLFSIAAIIMGHIALGRTKHSRIQPAPGSKMALIGTILGYAGLCVVLTLLATYSIWSKFVPALSGE
ncbi:MAG: DUF4190 domain-containing protein [Verrucomicrobia bacterium]|nr:DUF4190 domain-containing protein [Verrucomicrobiota bacterium]